MTKKKELSYRHPDCQSCKDTVQHIRERARDVAAELMGSCDSLHHVLGEAEEHLNDDQDFCDALDEMVMQCNGCGWWNEPCMVNDEDDTCDNCEEPDSDDDLDEPEDREDEDEETS